MTSAPASGSALPLERSVMVSANVAEWPESTDVTIDQEESYCGSTRMQRTNLKTGTAYQLIGFEHL
eukprot:COSAG02_NODE_9119_length_2323_cov_226.028777_3_plen_66_part_00